jgi:hypothetical protein
MDETSLVWAVLGVGSALLVAICGVYCYMKRRGQEQRRYGNQLPYEEV